MSCAIHDRIVWPDYTGELRSGNFGPNSGRYAVYIELGNTMERLYWASDGRTWWPTRDAAWQAGGSRIGRVAVVGLP